LVERYFQEAQARKSQQESQDLWRAYQHLRYDGDNCGNAPCLSNFRVIEEIPSVPVFVPLCKADEYWIQYFFTPQVLREKDWKRRQEAYLRHRRYLHERMLQVPEFRAKKNPPPEWHSGLRWIPINQLDDFYDLETGFRWLDEELDQAWIV